MLSNAWGTDSPSGLIIANVVLITIASYFCSIVVFQLDELNIWSSAHVWAQLPDTGLRHLLESKFHRSRPWVQLFYNTKVFFIKIWMRDRTEQCRDKSSAKKKTNATKNIFGNVTIASSNKLRIVFMAPPPPTPVAFIGFSSTHESSPQATAYRSPQY